MRTLRSILAATDLSAPSRHAAWRAAMVAADCGASLALTHTVAASALGDLRRWPAGDEAAARVVMGRQGRHALDELLLGSTTRMVVAEGDVDMLISNRQAG